MRKNISAISCVAYHTAKPTVHQYVLQCQWRRPGEESRLMNLYLRQEDMVRFESDGQGAYQLCWLPSLPLATESVMQCLHVPARQSYHDMGIHPWQMGEDAGWMETLKAFLWQHAGIEATDFGRFSTLSGQLSAPLEIYYARSNDGLYMVDVKENLAQLSKPAPVQAASQIAKWLAHTHRALSYT